MLLFNKFLLSLLILLLMLYISLLTLDKTVMEKKSSV